VLSPPPRLDYELVGFVRGFDYKCDGCGIHGKSAISGESIPDRVVLRCEKCHKELVFAMDPTPVLQGNLPGHLISGAGTPGAQ
jgi:hypothetical protein